MDILIAIIGGILTGLFGLYLNKKNNIRRLEINYEETCIVSKKISSIEGISVKYKNKLIDEYKCTVITCTNKGNTYVVAEDFNKNDPWSMKVNEGIFLFNEDIAIDGCIIESPQFSNFHLIKDLSDPCRVNVTFKKIPSKTKLNKAKSERNCNKVVFKFYHTGSVQSYGSLVQGEFYDEKSIIPKRIRDRFIPAVLCGIVTIVLFIMILLDNPEIKSRFGYIVYIWATFMILSAYYACMISNDISRFKELFNFDYSKPVFFDIMRGKYDTNSDAGTGGIKPEEETN